ncbi:MAG: hypothetical protein V8R46_07620 [Eubacterium ramulus]
MKNKYVFTAVLLAMILFVGSVLTMAYVRAEQKKEQAKDEDLLVVTSFIQCTLQQKMSLVMWKV